MGKIVVSSMVSIDGYTEGSEGDVSKMPMDLAFAEHNADRVRSAGRLVFGAVSYLGMMQYWPNQVDNPEAIPGDQYIASRYATDLDITDASMSVKQLESGAGVDQCRGGFGDRPASQHPVVAAACGAVADEGMSTRRAMGGRFSEEISDEGAPQGDSRTAGCEPIRKVVTSPLVPPS